MSSYQRNLDKTEVTAKLTKFLEAKEEILSAYIFGSFVSSDLFHDIDIAVFLKENSGYKDLSKFPYGYESNLLPELNLLLRTDKIDLVVLNGASPLLTMRIINRGMRLFDKDKYIRIEFENRSRSEYYDLEPLRRIQDQYLKRKLGLNA